MSNLALRPLDSLEALSAPHVMRSEPTTNGPPDSILTGGILELQKQVAYRMREGVLLVRYRDDLPPWFAPVLERLRELLELAPGWDSHGARAIRPQVAVDALNLLLSAMQPQTPAPAVVPTARGFVQFEWHRGGVDLEVELVSAHCVHVYLEDQRDGQVVDEELTADLSPLLRCVDRLTRIR